MLRGQYANALALLALGSMCSLCGQSLAQRSFNSRLENPLRKIEPGDKVIVFSESPLPIYHGPDIVGYAYFGEVYEAGKSEDKWLYLPNERGWVRRSDVIPYRTAIGLLSESLERRPSAEAYRRRGYAWWCKKNEALALRDFNKALQIDTSHAASFAARGAVYLQWGLYDKALEELDRALKKDSKLVGALNDRAWLRATCPEAKYRNADAALADARTACELSGWRDAIALGAYAAAYAEAGDFDQAIKWQRKAIDVASRTMKKALEDRLMLYKNMQPCRHEPMRSV